MNLGGKNGLTIESLVSSSRGNIRVSLSDDVKDKIIECRKWIDEGIDSNVGYYGINTGFGSLAKEMVDPSDMKRLSRNILKSHSCGYGDPYDKDVVKATMIIRANSLARGYSGVRLELIDKLIEFINKDIYPYVPLLGSLGASGDLAPLSHLGMCLSAPVDEEDTDDGFVFVPADVDTPSNFFHITEDRNGKQILWSKVAAREHVDQIVFGAKEGLAFNNGATVSAALAALNVSDAKSLVEYAKLAYCLSIEGIMGFKDPLIENIHQVRGYVDPLDFAIFVNKVIDGSTFMEGGKDEDPKRCPPQDPYTFRCSPQVFGSVIHNLRHIEEIIKIEINAVTDNPLIFLDLEREYKCVSGGNFHGAPIAHSMDLLKIIMTDLSSLSERRTFQLTVHPELPTLLIKNNAGLNSGFMIPQYTAASIVSDSKTLSHPDSVDSIPSSGNQEDHVSMSLNSARHARNIIENTEKVISIEFLNALQAINIQQEKYPEKRLGTMSQFVYDYLRENIDPVEYDRDFSDDFQTMLRIVRNGSLLEFLRINSNLYS